jgi:hypothetical protein
VGEGEGLLEGLAHGHSHSGRPGLARPRGAQQQRGAVEPELLQFCNFTVGFSHFTERRIILQHKSDLSARWNLTVYLPEAAGSDPTMNPAKSRFSLLTIPTVCMHRIGSQNETAHPPP